jgi:hypothetical protein
MSSPTPSVNSFSSTVHASKKVRSVGRLLESIILYALPVGTSFLAKAFIPYLSTTV